MKKLKNCPKILRLLATAFAVLALFAQSKAQVPNSVPSSPNSGTRAASEKKEFSQRDLIDACAAAAEELAKTRQLASAFEEENRTLVERLEIAKRSSAIQKELNETRKSETEALKAAVAAKNETIATKDAVIGKQEDLVRELKNKKTSPWKRLGDVLLGVAVFAVLK